jgi:hypothetical protein
MGDHCAFVRLSAAVIFVANDNRKISIFIGRRGKHLGRLRHEESCRPCGVPALPRRRTGRQIAKRARLQHQARVKKVTVTFCCGLLTEGGYQFGSINAASHLEAMPTTEPPTRWPTQQAPSMESAARDHPTAQIQASRFENRCLSKISVASHGDAGFSFKSLTQKRISVIKMPQLPAAVRIPLCPPSIGYVTRGTATYGGS